MIANASDLAAILSGIGVLLSGIAAMTATLAGRRAKHAEHRTMAVERQLDPGNGKSLGRTVADLTNHAEHNRQVLDSIPLTRAMVELQGLLAEQLKQRQEKP